MRLHPLKQLRRAGLDSIDLITFYGFVHMPILEYACPVRHTSLAENYQIYKNIWGTPIYSFLIFLISFFGVPLNFERSY